MPWRNRSGEGSPHGLPAKEGSAEDRRHGAVSLSAANYCQLLPTTANYSVNYSQRQHVPLSTSRRDVHDVGRVR